MQGIGGFSPTQHVADVHPITGHASARWEGGHKNGTGGAIDRRHGPKAVPFSLDIPFNQSGAAPLELMAAAHVSSFSLALFKELRLKSAARGKIVATATATTTHELDGWKITSVHLTVAASLPRMTQARFIGATVRAKTNCLISRSLQTNISMNAKLEN